MYNWELFHLDIDNYTFYQSEVKIQYRYDPLFAHRTSLHNMPKYTALLKWDESRTKILAIRKYTSILTPHNLVVVQNTTLEGVPINEMNICLSENTLYRCVDGLNKVDYQFLTT